MQPALHVWKVWTATEEQRVGLGRLRCDGELSSPTFEHSSSPFSFPTLLARSPEHLSLQGIGEVVLGDPMLPIGVGIAVPLSIAEGFTIAIGIAEMAWHRLVLSTAYKADGFEQSHRAVAFFGAGQIQGCLGKRVKPLW
jgi:hypothetical protein